jgi:phosphopantothenate synthetase
MSTLNWLRDPTAETETVMRARRAPPKSLDGLTVGLFDIGKTRSDEFLNQVEKRMAERGIRTRRYAKPTNAKVAPREVVEQVVAEADVVLIGLSD